MDPSKLGLLNLGLSIYGRQADYSISENAIEELSQERPTKIIEVAEKITAPAPQPAPINQKIRVLTVDDSTSVLLVLKKMIESNPNFQVVGNAKNGLEAKKFLDENPDGVDIITLDIHMPEQNGIEFLEQSYDKKKHPPVVMVTSVSRDDADVAAKAINLGAVDYVEKPSLQDIELRAEEINSKLSFVYKMASIGKLTPISETISKDFSRSPMIRDTDKRLRIIVATAGDIFKLRSILANLRAPQPPTVVLLDCQAPIISSLTKNLVEATEQDRKETGLLIAPIRR